MGATSNAAGLVSAQHAAAMTWIVRWRQLPGSSHFVGMFGCCGFCAVTLSLFDRPGDW
jgi:hypothetical protein